MAKQRLGGGFITRCGGAHITTTTLQDWALVGFSGLARSTLLALADQRGLIEGVCQWYPLFYQIGQCKVPRARRAKAASTNFGEA